MKAAKTTFSEGIPQALAKGHCPVCTIVGDFQEQLIAGTQSCEVSGLCNYHAWAVAKAAPAEAAARLFLDLVESNTRDWQTPDPVDECSLCKSLDDHETRRLYEMVEQLKRAPIRKWMKLQGTFCLGHARKLNAALPEELRDLILEITARSRAELTDALTSFLTHMRTGDGEGWGVLGRVAEFLTSQRGMGR